MQAVAARAMLAWLVQETLNSKLSTIFRSRTKNPSPLFFVNFFNKKRENNGIACLFPIKTLSLPKITKKPKEYDES